MKLLPPSNSEQPGAPNVPYFKSLIESVLNRHVYINVPLKAHECELVNNKLKDIFMRFHIEVTMIDTIEAISNMYTQRMHDVEKDLFTNKL